jgi:hypothetical protein
MLKNPSSGVTSDGDLLELTCDDISMEGERLFHAATTLRTEVNGDRGDVCGRFNDATWVVALVLVGP